MTTQRDSKKLLLASILALILTIVGGASAAYRWLSTRATRWGDSLIVGPRFSGTTSLDGGTTWIRVEWENGVPVLDAPSWKIRGRFPMTFFLGFVIYHPPPGTLDPKPSSAR